MPWSEETHGGFTTGEPWLPVDTQGPTPAQGSSLDAFVSTLAAAGSWRTGPRNRIVSHGRNVQICFGVSAAAGRPDFTSRLKYERHQTTVAGTVRTCKDFDINLADRKDISASLEELRPNEGVLQEVLA
jgi:hypothetical protein